MVSYIALNADDPEEMCYYEAVSEDSGRDNDAEEPTFNDIGSQIFDKVSEDESTPAAESTPNIGSHKLRDRSSVKKRDFDLHLYVETVIQKLGKAAVKSTVKEMYQLEKKSVLEAVNWKRLSIQEHKNLVGTV